MWPFGVGIRISLASSGLIWFLRLINIEPACALSSLEEENCAVVITLREKYCITLIFVTNQYGLFVIYLQVLVYGNIR